MYGCWELSYWGTLTERWGTLTEQWGTLTERAVGYPDGAVGYPDGAVGYPDGAARVALLRYTAEATLLTRVLNAPCCAGVADAGEAAAATWAPPAGDRHLLPATSAAPGPPAGRGRGSLPGGA
eukprot:807167-Prorocentrum_minimum.AAC.2